jgi:RNA 2',3'-cyclic 3'-phosphodiesterase
VRLFLAISLDPSVRDAVSAALAELRTAAPQIKWVRAENLHVTLKFLGETPQAKLDALQSALSMIRLPGAIQLDFRGLGFFPNEKRAKVLWLGMNASPNLPELAAAIDHAAHSLGFPLEDRPFTPHLTLARFSTPGLPQALSEPVRKISAQSFGSQTATNFNLIESKLKPSGAEYTTLHSFRFAPEA